MNFEGYHLEEPLALLLLLLIPIMIYQYRKGGQNLRLKVPKKLHSKDNRFVGMMAHFGFICRILAIILCIIAMARPQFGRERTKRTQEGLDIFLVIDTSKSMSEPDFIFNSRRYDRLTLSKWVIRKFIEGRVDDRIGIVAFADYAIPQAPLTLDHDVLIEFLQEIQIGIVGRMTAIGDAIATATNRLKDVESKNKMMIVLTDGENTAGKIDPNTALQAAKALGVKIYTVGLGNRREINIKQLKQIAEETGGRFFHAQNTQALLESYDYIDKLEKTKKEVEVYRQYDEKFSLFIWPALFFILLEFLITWTPFRRLP